MSQMTPERIHLFHESFKKLIDNFPELEVTMFIGVTNNSQDVLTDTNGCYVCFKDILDRFIEANQFTHDSPEVEILARLPRNSSLN